MKVVVTGQVGLDKKSFLQRAAELVCGNGSQYALCNIGDMMYAEAPDVPAGKILDLPLSRLNNLRRSVFKDVLAECRHNDNIIVNTHATFRWRHGLFYAFDYDQMKALHADLYICLVDNVDAIHYRLSRDGHANYTLKDLMVWREEEILATELLSQIVRGHGRFYVLARGMDDGPAEAMAGLLTRPYLKKAYLSFPMSHLAGAEAAAAAEAIGDFRRQMKRYFICFDPGDLEEKYLCKLALEAAEQGHRTVEYGQGGMRAVLATNQLLDIIADIDGQIYARDFKLIDQSDMIISLVPAMSDGRPALSSGVERELQHAHEAAKDVFVVWLPQAQPSPFITETATAVFTSVRQAVDYFLENGFVPEPPGGTLFG
ncbi:MAG: AAA family ATPase [Planctomycetes bacterium]|nr:AAA family ATPase [Planctomycetota bacterium]